MKALRMMALVLLLGGCASPSAGGGQFERLRRRSPYRLFSTPVQAWLEDSWGLRRCPGIDSSCS